MTLKKRTLRLLCSSCSELPKSFLKHHDITKEMKKEMDEMKKEIIQIKKLIDNQNEQESSVPVNTAYADTVRKSTTSKTVENIPSIIRPKKMQTPAITRKDIDKNIRPAEINIGIRNIRSTKTGSFIIKCSSKQEIELLKNEAEKKMKEDYIVEETKLRRPRVKIVGYTKDIGVAQIKQSLKSQNKFFEENDEIKVTFINKKRKNDTSTIFEDCSAGLFHKLVRQKKVYIGWERYPVFEDLSIPRCFKCQGFYHKNKDCSNKKVCYQCAEEHEESEYPKLTKKCKNCESANIKYKTKYDIKHEATDLECPTYRYFINVLKSKIDYFGSNG